MSKACGVKGNATNENTAINAAVAVAIAVKGTVCFPPAQIYGVSSIVIPDNTHGLTISSCGGVSTSPVGGQNNGSSIESFSGGTVISAVGTASGGTGSISDITISNIQINGTGAGSEG